MNYIKPDVEADTKGEEIKKSYPIITIYILGYSLVDIPYLAVTVNNTVIDMVSKKQIELKSDFVSQLTHKSYILQVKRLPKERLSRLEQFLTLFNQAWKTQDGFILDIKEIPEEFREVANYLNLPLSDDLFRRQLQAEEDVDRLFNEQENKYLLQLEESRKKEKEAKQRAEDERMQKEEAKETIKNMVKKLNARGIIIPEIALMLEKTEDEIKAMLSIRE
jgi:hypothetical protein